MSARQPATSGRNLNDDYSYRQGPWERQTAKDVADLHSADNKLSKENDLSEKGEPINGYGDKPNRLSAIPTATGR